MIFRDPVDSARTWVKTTPVLLTIFAIALMAPTAKASFAFNFIAPTSPQDLAQIPPRKALDMSSQPVLTLWK